MSALLKILASILKDNGVSFVAEPGVGSLTLTGLAPVANPPLVVTPGVGSLTLTGLAPVVVPPDNVTFIGGSRSASGNPATVVFTISDNGSHSSLTGQGSQWETVNNPTPVDTYHIKWEDHDTLPNETTNPFAKSTWTLLTGAGPFSWSHTESAPDISSKGFKLFISNDGGSTTLESADVSMTADATP
jgi:hypothetical protein